MTDDHGRPDPPDRAAGDDIELIGDIDTRPPPARLGLLAAQQVLVSNAWLDPIFIAGVAGLSSSLATNLVTATFLAAGVATFAQTLRLVRLPILEGPSSAFSPLAIAYSKAGTLAAAGTGLLIGAGIIFCLAVTGVISKVRAVLSPAVSGTIIALVGLSLAGFAVQEFLGTPGSATFFTGPTMVLALVTILAVIVGTAVGGTLRTFCFLGALVVGDLLAAAFGMLDFSGVAAAPWLALPTFLPYGPLRFDLGITLTMVIVFFVAVVEAMGMYQATARVTGQRLTSRRINAGVAGEAGGSMLSAALGAFGTTAYAQNLGVVELTRVASRHVMRLAAVVLVALAFLPKVGAALVATPAPVVGGLFLPAAATVVMTGLRMAMTERGTPSANLVAPLGIMAGLGVAPLAAPLAAVLPNWLASLLPHSIIVGTVVVMVLELLVIRAPALLRRARASTRRTAT